MCSVPFEDRDHLYTCPDEGANKVFKKGITELKQILEEKETAPDLQKAIIGILTGVRIGSLPRQYSFGQANFGLGLTLQAIIRDQANIRCSSSSQPSTTNFISCPVCCDNDK